MITRRPLLDMIPGGLDAPDMPTTVVMSIGPIEAKDFAPAPTMIRSYNRAMRRHQPLRIPRGLKDGFMHSAATRVRSVFPHVQIMDALQGFIRTQDQSRHIAADVCKPCCPAKQRAVVGQPSAYRLWDGDDREPALCP